jgi:predicted site-specific integrase-resolvase
MALSKGISKISVGKISLHTQTAFEIIKKFIPKININITCLNPNEKDEDLKENLIEIEGIGYI